MPISVATMDGSHMSHLLYKLEWPLFLDLPTEQQESYIKESQEILDDLFTRRERREAGALFQVLGKKSDLMILLMREDAHELAKAERQLNKMPIFPYLTLEYSYYSVVELSMHSAAHRLEASLVKEGLEKGTKEWNEAFANLLKEEAKKCPDRLFPEIPEGPFVCFYPMNKKREEKYNWFLLSPKERGELMKSHGMTGRQYFGKVNQVIGNSMGLDNYDWSVDLFGDDPIHFKDLIYDMRFDTVSAIYAEFGPFYIGCKQDLATIVSH